MVSWSVRNDIEEKEDEEEDGDDNDNDDEEEEKIVCNVRVIFTSNPLCVITFSSVTDCFNSNHFK